jgi:hypothetical protein
MCPKWARKLTVKAITRYLPGQQVAAMNCRLHIEAAMPVADCQRTFIRSDKPREAGFGFSIG